jgi:hypothetical protein
MAGSVRIEINSAGIRELLKSPEVQNELGARADRIAAAAGGEPDYEVEVIVGATRARASVRTTSFEAIRAEAKDRTLLSALDAGR